jgi:hypothetical protein
MPNAIVRLWFVHPANQPRTPFVGMDRFMSPSRMWFFIPGATDNDAPDNQWTAFCI